MVEQATLADAPAVPTNGTLAQESEPPLVRKARRADAKLKVLAWGESGAGKSRFALSFPSPLVIDLEQSTALYGDEFDFLVAEPTTKVRPHQLVSIVRQQIANGEHPDVRTLIVDPITVYLDHLEAALIDEQRAKGVNLDNLKGPTRAKFYAQMKDEVARRLEALLALPVHTVWVARAKNEWGQTDGGMAPIGRTYDANDLVEYLADLVLHLKRDGAAEVRKSRIADLGSSLTRPTFATIQAALAKPSEPAEAKVTTVKKEK